MLFEQQERRSTGLMIMNLPTNLRLQAGVSIGRKKRAENWSRAEKDDMGGVASGD